MTSEFDPKDTLTRRGWTAIIAAFLAMGVGFAIVWWISPPEKLVPKRGLDIDGTECVEACIKALQANRVFPDFQSIVKECDERFGNGCRLQ